MNLVKNQIIELNIDSVTSQGSGVGRTEDKIAVFVPQSAVGDRLRVKIVKVKKTYAFGKIESVISSSKDRIAAHLKTSSGRTSAAVWRALVTSRCISCSLRSMLNRRMMPAI